MLKEKEIHQLECDTHKCFSIYISLLSCPDTFHYMVLTCRLCLSDVSCHTYMSGFGHPEMGVLGKRIFSTIIVTCVLQSLSC